MTRLYRFFSSLLLWFVSEFAFAELDNSSGIVHTAVAVFLALTIAIRELNYDSKRIYRELTEKSSKCDILDLIYFDGALLIMYAGTASIGIKPYDAENWFYFCLMCVPVFAVSIIVIVNRYRKIKAVKNQNKQI